MGLMVSLVVGFWDPTRTNLHTPWYLAQTQLPWYPAHRPPILAGNPVLHSLAIAHRCTQVYSFCWHCRHMSPCSVFQLHLLAMRPPGTHRCTQNRVPDPARPVEIEITENTGSTAVINRPVTFAPYFSFLFLSKAPWSLSFPLSPPLSQ